MRERKLHNKYKHIIKKENLITIEIGLDFRITEILQIKNNEK